MPSGSMSRKRTKARNSVDTAIDPDAIEKENSALWLVLTLLALIAAAAGAAFMATKFDGDTRAYLLSISSSAAASLVVYLLVSVLAEPRRLRHQQQRAIRYAADYANNRFRALFRTSLPKAVYLASDIPTSDFSIHMKKQLATSRYYEIKGTSCKVATVRLQRAAINSATTKLREVRLYMVDPRAKDLLESTARMKLRESAQSRDADVREDAATTRVDCYVTLVMLFDLRDAMPTEVYLHRDLPFYRSEHFENAVFLSYYIGRKSFHETLVFGRKSRAFKAYEGARFMTRESSSMWLAFGGGNNAPHVISDEPRLETVLQELGCELQIEELRCLAQRRTEEISSNLVKAGIAAGELF